MSTIQAALTAPQQRRGIEWRFQDWKSGGGTLEGCQAIKTRLSAVVLLIAIAYIAYTDAIIQGIDISVDQRSSIIFVVFKSRYAFNVAIAVFG